MNARLDVLICSYGADGLRRIADGAHPAVEGVRYIVSWQIPADSEDVSPDIPKELERSDFEIHKIDSKGLSKNRNHALTKGTAPVCLIADDDVDYFEDGLIALMDVFDRHPEIGVASFMYEGNDDKCYPDKPVNLDKRPRGFYTSSIEMAFRRETVEKTGVKFDENFGLGARFGSGEEDLWLHSLLKNGVNGRFFPILIARHEGLSTGRREANNPEYVKTKGAVLRKIHPATWPLRMLTHAWRNHRSAASSIPTHRYIFNWLSGALAPG